MESERAEDLDITANSSKAGNASSSTSQKLEEIEKDFELISEGKTRFKDSNPPSNNTADNKSGAEDKNISENNQELDKDADSYRKEEKGEENIASSSFKKKHRKHRKCSSNSSHADSTSGKSHKKYNRIITLDSDKDSDSDENDGEKKSENLTQEGYSKGKRVAHIQADIMRKMSALRWSRSHKKKRENDTDSTSSSSVITKVRRRRRGGGTVSSRAAIARKRYFEVKKLAAVRTSSIRGSFRSMRGRGRRCVSNIGNRGLTQSTGFMKQRIGRPPNNGGKRGRPRKYFPQSEPSETREESANNSKQDDEVANESNDPLNRSGSSVEQKSSPVKEMGAVSGAKRGRPRLSFKNSNVKVKTIPINRKIKPFLQSSSCIDIIHKVPKCRECRLMAYYKKKNQHSYCRFLEYRKLCYAKNGTILNAGFSTASECNIEDMRSWLPAPNHLPEDLNFDSAKALLMQVGDQFCDLIMQEKDAVLLNMSADKTITWKRIMQGVREMCDVCDTTLFNMHWVCPKCGIAVCIDCYKVRKQGIIIEKEESLMRGRDEYNWLQCNFRQPHEQDKLILAQIIPGNALALLQKIMHEVRESQGITAYCKCKPRSFSKEVVKSAQTGICKQLMSSVLRSFQTPLASYNYDYPNEQSPKMDMEINDSMDWLTNDIALLEHQTSDQCFTNGLNYDSPCYENFASLKNTFFPEVADRLVPMPTASFLNYSMDDIIDCLEEAKPDKDTLKFFKHRYPQRDSGRDPHPIRIFTTTESSLKFDVAHSWLCNGRLLLLHQANHHKNLELFQDQWKRGQPIMVMGVDKGLDMSLWHPDGFCRDFGDVKNDLVNCKTGVIIPDLPMRRFWEGFENFDKRMKDDYGEYMLLKLKDWPPGEDFSEKLPTRFNDLMKGLPLPEYTHRNGIFNLAGRLPSWFVRPDLGPKMYNAYGSALFPSKGTTNLHLDMSDAVNVMVYVGVPHDGKHEIHILEALKAIDEGGCDSLMRERVRSRGVKPGALWHIYNARDADKIREMLNKVAIERGEKLEAQHDPIHDQSWYLDEELRRRLYHEYAVEGYAIAQCLGDAVFIPAGAPHQVRNLHSCVKIAEDFVSPENIGHCFKLTQEFRHLSDTHTNHEDKLQIKNIIYHVVKDSLSHLMNEEVCKNYEFLRK